MPRDEVLTEDEVLNFLGRAPGLRRRRGRQRAMPIRSPEGWSPIAMDTALWFRSRHERTLMAISSFLRTNWAMRCTETGLSLASSGATPGEVRPPVLRRAPKGEWCGSWAVLTQLLWGSFITGTAAILSLRTNPASITRSSFLQAK